MVVATVGSACTAEVSDPTAGFAEVYSDLMLVEGLGSVQTGVVDGLATEAELVTPETWVTDAVAIGALLVWTPRPIVVENAAEDSGT